MKPQYISLKDARLLASNLPSASDPVTDEDTRTQKAAFRRLQEATGRTAAVRQADLELARNIGRLWAEQDDRIAGSEACPTASSEAQLFVTLPNGKEVQVNIKTCGALDLPASGTGSAPDMALWAQQIADLLGCPVQLSANFTSNPTVEPK